MNAPSVLRLAAVLIAVGGAVDPGLTWNTRVPPPVTIAIVQHVTPPPDTGDSSGRSGALRAAERLRALLAREFAVSVQTGSLSAGAAACPDEGGCILIADGARPRRVTGGATLLGVVHIPPRGEPAVSATRITAPAFASLAAGAALEVDLTRHGAVETTELEAFDGRTLVGRAVHRWSAEDREGSTARVPLDWVPVAEGVRHIRVMAISHAPGTSVSNHVADMAVAVTSARHEVLVEELQPTWAATFVRRALEDDSRFRIRARTRLGGGLSASAGAPPPLARALDHVAAVIVGAPNLLTLAEVRTLDDFARLRGGSVVVLLDERPRGPVTRLLPSAARDRRTANGEAVGPLRATELITFPDLEPGTTVLASAADQAVIVVRASGHGRVIVSGALDAWRYRADTGFGRFWTAIVAEAAAAAGSPLAVRLSRSAARPGDEVQVDVEWRARLAPSRRIEAAAALVCDGAERSLVRLWPAGAPGRFSGTVRTGGAGTCTVEVTVTGPVQAAERAPLVIVADAAAPVVTGAELQRLAALHGARFVTEGDEELLLSAARERMPAIRAGLQTFPTRTPWWIVPLVSCLGGEWWLRRRRGLR